MMPHDISLAAQTQIAPEPVRAALDDALRLGEIGVQVCAWHRGEMIVDAWAGRRAEDGPPVDGDTVFNIFSVGKGPVAACAHLQADRGLIDYDAPIATYWPEFGTHGKDAVTMRHILSHRSGVPQMPAGVDAERMKDWSWMITGLERETPMFPPGSTNTYQSMVFGWLIGEVVRRTDPARRDLATFLSEEICAPLGMDRYFTVLPDAEVDGAAMLSGLSYPAEPEPDSALRRAVPKPLDFRPAFFNRTDIRQARVSGFGDLANARSVARFFAMVAAGGVFQGKRILSEQALRDAAEEREDYHDADQTYGTTLTMQVGRGGFWVETPAIPPLDRRDAQKILCNPGAGGSLGWADLDNDLAIAITHNRMFTAIPEHPWPALAAAVLEVAGITR
jgi:CubicO group peptidase (beta-lactamase class C family)